MSKSTALSKLNLSPEWRKTLWRVRLLEESWDKQQWVPAGCAGDSGSQTGREAMATELCPFSSSKPVRDRIAAHKNQALSPTGYSVYKHHFFITEVQWVAYWKIFINYSHVETVPFNGFFHKAFRQFYLCEVCVLTNMSDFKPVLYCIWKPHSEKFDQLIFDIGYKETIFEEVKKKKPSPYDLHLWPGAVQLKRQSYKKTPGALLLQQKKNFFFFKMLLFPK